VSWIGALTTWIASHADSHGADGARLLIAGESAGAHLALMVGLTPDRDDLDPGCGDPARVDGVIAFSAPTDLTALAAGQGGAANAVSDYVGDCPAALAACGEQAPSRCQPCVDASPLAHACRARTHFILVQAADPFDPLIPQSQAQTLADAFVAAGVSHDLVIVGALFQIARFQLYAHYRKRAVTTRSTSR